MRDEDKFQVEKIYQFLSKEIDLQEKRVWFFGALITALLTGWYYCKKNTDPFLKENLVIILPFFAFVISLIQSFLNRGSKYWLNYWNEEVKEIKDLNIFKNIENIKDKHLKGTGFCCVKRKVKIPMLFIFFADFVCINCFLLFLYEIIKNIISSEFELKYINLSLLAFLVINCFLIIFAFSCCNKWKIFNSKKLKKRWTQQTLNQINQHIIDGLNIDTNISNGRIILQRNLDGNNNLMSFSLSIGANTNINVPITMLKDCYNAAYNNNRIYNTSIFQRLYPNDYRRHVCYVHVIGMIFYHAKLVRSINGNNYTLI